MATNEKKDEKVQPKNLYQKILAVSSAVKNIEKDMTVGKGNYQYKAVSDNSVTLAVKRAEEEHGLVSIPVKQELVSSEVLRSVNDNGQETIKFVDNIKMTLRIVDVDKPDDFVEVESFGKGVDTADKGFGKASTYARKYALLNAYKIATGEDPDANKSEKINVPKTVNEKSVAIQNYFAKNNAKLPALLKHFGVESLDDLSDAEIEVTFKTYHEKGLL